MAKKIIPEQRELRKKLAFFFNMAYKPASNNFTKPNAVLFYQTVLH